MLSDDEISELVEEEKILPDDFGKSIKLKEREHTKFKVGEVFIQSRSGNRFQIIIRTNTINRFDFSIILLYVDENNIQYILRRYNGKHQHKNKIENVSIYGFHIHKATERYQREYDRIDGYAEITDAYSNWGDALSQMIQDCNFVGNIFVSTPVAALVPSN